MSGTLPADVPDRLHPESDAVALVVHAKQRDLGGFMVRRALPSMQRRAIGPFVFLDQMGPTELGVGEGFDVRPHPHIGLATVTYLFDGEVVHRDSLGTEVEIRPGDVNWMFAGRGIVHSERSSAAARARGIRMHGIQSWVAVPSEREEDAPSFEHHDAVALPKIAGDGVSIDVIAGTLFGACAPTNVCSPTLYAHAKLERGARFTLDDEHEERAIYVVEGSVGTVAGAFEPGQLVMLHAGRTIAIEAREPSRIMILGGEKLPGQRHIEWNFVSSRPERIERAKADWKADRFPKVPGDDTERIPLPER